MDWITKLLGGPIKDVIASVGGVIDNLHTSDAEKAQAKLALATIESQYQIRVLELSKDFAATQADVIKAEIASKSVLARNWRPVTALVFVFIIFNNYVLVPYAHAFGAAIPTLEIPNGMWALLTTMISGYAVGRTAEKIVHSRTNKP